MNDPRCHSLQSASVGGVEFIDIYCLVLRYLCRRSVCGALSSFSLFSVDRRLSGGPSRRTPVARSPTDFLMPVAGNFPIISPRKISKIPDTNMLKMSQQV